MIWKLISICWEFCGRIWENTKTSQKATHGSTRVVILVLKDISTTWRKRKLAEKYPTLT
jgi:hypothetical protein